MPEFRVRVEFDVEVDNPSHIDAAFAAADFLTGLGREDRLDSLVYETAVNDGEVGEFKTVDLEQITRLSEDVEPDTTPTFNIADTCCGKCPGGTCYVDQITGA